MFGLFESIVYSDLIDCDNIYIDYLTAVHIFFIFLLFYYVLSMLFVGEKILL